jgi:IS30 family transposase
MLPEQERRADMSDTKSMRNKHMTLDDRLEIQGCLDRGMAFKAIARRIGKDPTTVSKEVKKHFTVKQRAAGNTAREGAAAEPRPCPSLLRAPFVCNPCRKRHSACAYQKQLYSAKTAQTEYESLLSEAREGIPLNQEKFYEVDGIITKCVKKGQHLYHIMQTNDLGVSKSTVYRHLHRGYLSISKMDLPRAVKFKARKARPADYVPKAAKIGRTYGDFLVYRDERNISAWVEMDTVIGRIGGKAIMTFDFTLCNFMFGLLVDDRTSAESTLKIRALKEKMRGGGIRFGDVFPLLLTDNGGEFANVSAFTDDADGDAETDLFFCDPYQSSQKPRVEKNHTMFRDIVPKGSSFDNFTQETVDLIFSHVNSVKRKILYGKSPYEMFAFTFGGNIAELLGIIPIPADDVVQSPKLLKLIIRTMK